MSQKTIMIVDDEQGFTQMVRLTLEATGHYRVVVENDPSRAIYTALKYRPHLILLDVIMPEREGPDVLNQLEAEERLRDIPVVFLTATITADEAAAENGRVGGRVFLPKPVPLTDLMHTIEREARCPRYTNPPGVMMPILFRANNLYHLRPRLSRRCGRLSAAARVFFPAPIVRQIPAPPWRRTSRPGERPCA